MEWGWVEWRDSDLGPAFISAMAAATAGRCPCGSGLRLHASSEAQGAQPEAGAPVQGAPFGAAGPGSAQWWKDPAPNSTRRNAPHGHTGTRAEKVTGRGSSSGQGQGRQQCDNPKAALQSVTVNTNNRKEAPQAPGWRPARCVKRGRGRKITQMCLWSRLARVPLRRKRGPGPEWEQRYFQGRSFGNSLFFLSFLSPLCVAEKLINNVRTGAGSGPHAVGLQEGQGSPPGRSAVRWAPPRAQA